MAKACPDCGSTIAKRHTPLCAITELDSIRNLPTQEGSAVLWNGKLPDGEKCYDCGSTLPNRHTKLCQFSQPGDKLDLPAEKGTQWWTGELPEHTSKKKVVGTYQKDQPIVEFNCGDIVEVSWLDEPNSTGIVVVNKRWGRPSNNLKRIMVYFTKEGLLSLDSLNQVVRVVGNVASMLESSSTVEQLVDSVFTEEIAKCKPGQMLEVQLEVARETVTFIELTGSYSFSATCADGESCAFSFDQVVRFIK